MSDEHIPYADPLRSGRHPFQTYMLSIGLISGMPLVFGDIAPGSIEETLPPALVASWGIMLVGGSFLGLLGSYWPKKQYDTALTLERIGLVFTGLSAIVYGGIIMYAIRTEGLIAGGLIAGFGIACLIRAKDIGKIFHRALELYPPQVEKEPGR